MAELESQLQSVPDSYSRIKRDITRGVFPAGQKLLMSALKERYGLGVGPLREALSQLVAEHLVVAVNQKGYRVAPMSLDEMRDIYDARANLEAMILTLAIERGDDSWEALILARSHTLSKVVEVKTQDQMLDVWDERHKAFHSAIASGCGSKHLLQLRSQLLDQAERYRHLWLKSTVFSEEALNKKRKEHATLVEAILKRDAKKASELMRDHLLTPIPIIAEVIRETLGS
ncbi:GntR family transcriptional regulator [Pseudomonas jessenii]|uniref:GntR family transcriptional regulator n=1 Tax=Pseudomonas jessenii TaxID=77298 RepID=A0A2W0F5Q9_PSEJE|nr:DNA-binding transcriptional regulator CsiR [Pseudomonas jessenii]PYY72515.1 GntR family transcriptional regulator [Pseudomonas jessenii]